MTPPHTLMAHREELSFFSTMKLPGPQVSSKSSAVAKTSSFLSSSGDRQSVGDRSILNVSTGPPSMSPIQVRFVSLAVIHLDRFSNVLLPARRILRWAVSRKKG